MVLKCDSASISHSGGSVPASPLGNHTIHTGIHPAHIHSHLPVCTGHGEIFLQSHIMVCIFCFHQYDRHRTWASFFFLLRFSKSQTQKQYLKLSDITRDCPSMQVESKGEAMFLKRSVIQMSSFRFFPFRACTDLIYLFLRVYLKMKKKNPQDIEHLLFLYVRLFSFSTHFEKKHAQVRIHGFRGVQSLA